MTDHESLNFSRTSKRFGWLGAVLLLAVVVGVFFHESLFLNYSLVPADILHYFLLPPSTNKGPIGVQNHYPIDQVVQTYPAEVYWQKSIQEGQVPLWNPYIYGGHPQLSTSMWGVLCPAKVLLFFCSPERAHTLGYILEFFLAAIFMRAFLRELGQSHMAAFLGACAYAFNSQFLMMYWLWMNVFSYVPLVLWLLERSIRRNSWGYAVASGCVMAVPLISGSIQMTFYVLFLCGFYALASLWWRPAEQRRQALGQLSVLFALAALASAIQFLPTLELLGREAGGRIRNSDSGDLAGWVHTVLGIPALITFAFPALAGSSETYDLLKVFRGTMMHFTGYYGLIPFVLFIVGAQFSHDKRIRILRLLIIIVIGVVFFTPLVRFVYHRFFALAIFAMTVLAGYGFDALLEWSPEGRKKIQRTFVLMTGLCVLVVLGLLAVQWYVHGHYAQLLEIGNKYVVERIPKAQFHEFPEWLLSRIPLFLHHFRISNPLFWVPLGSFAGALGCWLAYTRQKLNRPFFAGALVTLSLIDLLFFGRTLVPQVDLQRHPFYPPIPVLAKAQADPDLFRIYRLIPNSVILMENTLMAYGLSSFSGYESLFPENLISLPVYTNGQFNALLDLANAKYVLTTSSNALPPERFELATEADGLRLYRNKTCLPRLRFVPAWQVVSDRTQLMAQMASERFNPRDTVLLENEPVLPQDGAKPGERGAGATGTVEMQRYSSQKISARVRSDNGGFVLLADTWYPGWKARVDGLATPLHRADFILKGIYVPAGDHQIEFFFAPRPFFIGAAISLLTLIGAIAWGVCRFWFSGQKPASKTVCVASGSGIG